MCGIAGGVWDTPGRRVSLPVLNRMTDILRHRGPDGRGTYLREYDDGTGCALGHRRLAIIDLEGGQQPLANEDETIWVTFNGEIYNYQELAGKLRKAGHALKTSSDTEVLVHLYEDYGTRCLDFLRGMFAFAIWDESRRRLFMARDRLGQKPLVYRSELGRLLFASEIKSLLQVPDVPRHVDNVAIDEYLTYLYVPTPRTIFAGISKMPPGHFATLEDGEFKLQRYWNPDLNRSSQLDTTELQGELGQELNEAVRLRMRSDVPLGAFLSGGIDSTAIAGLMQANSTSPVRTFTIGFPFGDVDESRHARLAADHLRTDHHVFQAESSCVSLLPQLTWHFDEPFGDASAIPTFQVAQFASQHVKVALSGDGGDELFAGYGRYRTAEQMGRFDRMPKLIRKALQFGLWQRLPVSEREFAWSQRFRARLESLSKERERRLAYWVTIFYSRLREQLYTDAFRDSLEGNDPVERIAEAGRIAKKRSAGKQAMIADLITYLPCDLLTKVDVTTMANGLECRSPFLDHRVVELALSMPFGILAGTGKANKPMISKTFAQFIPAELRHRSKTGFCPPMDAWFRGELKEWAHEILLDGTCLARGYFKSGSLERLLKQHANGMWEHGERIWALLMLEYWHRNYVDSQPAASREESINELATIEA